jgi:hypothetical protein
MLSSGGRKYLIRIDAKYDERDEGILFSRPGRWMISSGIYIGNTLQYRNIHEVNVKAPKVPFFHLDAVYENFQKQTLLFMACEFYKKIKFLTSNYLSSQHDKIVIYFDTSSDQFVTDLGIKGKSLILRISEIES